jgi:hypothetical protein
MILIERKNRDTTTYTLRCPSSVPASDCGIRGAGMTAIRAPTSVQVINIDENDK